MTVGAWLRGAKARLAEIDAPGIEAEVLLASAMGGDRPWLLAHSEASVPLDADELLRRRLAREPLAYVLGWREFYGRRFTVNSSVLIPRQETETLVEAGLEVIDRGGAVEGVLDLCSGSGVIGITLKLERPEAKVILADISAEANGVARSNAAALGADVAILESDLFASLPGRFSLVVCNPPYVAGDALLAPEVGLHEPEGALFANENGLAVYRLLANEARSHLMTGSELWLEVGDGMASAVRSLFESAGWHFAGKRADLSGHVRVLGFSPGLP